MVLATFHREDYLRKCIEAANEQTYPLSKIIVVDNGQSQETRELCEQYESVEYVESPGNIGSFAGLAIGMRLAHERGADFVWSSDDDSAPVPHALETLVNLHAQNPECGVIGSAGGSLRLYPQHWPRGEAKGPIVDEDSGLRSAGFLEMDGTLWRSDVFDKAGFPRDDYFMAIGGVEISYRVRKAGFTLGLFDEELTHREFLGSGGAGKPPAPWRTYYQARNHLAMAITHRSPKLLLGWFIRQIKITTGNLVAGRVNRLEKLRWRIRGTADALLGRMGNRIDPNTYTRSKYT